jgi:cytochrome c-type biogenesis protein CcmH
MILFFWSILAAMALVGLAVALWPFLGSASGESANRRQANIAIYRERREELERARAEGRIDASQLEAQAAELDRILVRDTQEPEVDTGARAASSRERWLSVLALSLFIPAFSIGLYLQTADWRLSTAGDSAEGVEILLGRLKEQLERKPDNAEGWLLLARGHVSLRQFDSAVEAYAKFNALQTPPQPDTLVEEAETRAYAAGGALQGKPAEMIQQALSLNPGHVRGLWYAGLAEMQEGRAKQALKYWEPLSGQELTPEFREVLERQIVQAGGLPRYARQPQPDSVATMLRLPLRVELAPGLSRKLSPDLPVFIYARPVDGSRMPLAVVRRRVAELPLEIELTDRDSMAGARLSDHREWLLVARVGMTGAAQPSPDDPVAETRVSREAIPDRIGLVMTRPGT